MSETEPSTSGLSAALGRLPSGLYVLTAQDNGGGRRTGMLASWVQQAGFRPPMVTVALGLDRYVRDWIRDTGRFALNQVPASRKDLLRHFGKGFNPDEDALAGLVSADLSAANDAWILEGVLAYLVVEPHAEILTGDHAIVLGEIVSGGLVSPTEEPLIHVRKNGSHY